MRGRLSPRPLLLETLVKCRGFVTKGLRVTEEVVAERGFDGGVQTCH